MHCSMGHERACHSCLPVWFPEVRLATLPLTCLTNFSYVWTLLHLHWMEIFPKYVLLRLFKPCVTERVYFSEQGRVHAITFFHEHAMHLGGISLECQWWLFFPFAPIFCDGRNYSPPWQISIGSICETQECREQNKQREPSGCEAQQEAASELHDLTFRIYTL